MSRKNLQDSTLGYAFKANLYLHGITFAPCRDCPFKNLTPHISTDENCFQKCPHYIMVWLLNKAQWELYKRLRPPEKMKEEIRKGINEGRVEQIEQIMGASKITVAPSFLSKNYSAFETFLISTYYI